MSFHSIFSKFSKGLSLGTLALAFAGFFTGCASTESKDSAKNASDVNKIDMSAWKYNQEDNVYYQTGIQYLSNPADSQYENLGIFVPGDYFDGKDNGDGTWTVTLNANGKTGDFSAKDAPFVMPIQTPGYSACNPPSGYVSSVKEYTDSGLIFVYAGARGRDHGAPAGVTDFKAAIRYIRYNKDLLPGDSQRYFTYGMSGGGAQSALLGATGDAPEYEKYLEAIGAVMTESDAVMGSMDWCPITNLNVADEAYEWELGVARTGLDSESKAISEGLSKEFALYINSLGLKDEKGNALTLEESEDGLYHKGTYYDYLKKTIEESLNNFLKDTKFPYNPESQKAALGNNMMIPGGMNGRGPQGMGNPPAGRRPEAQDMDGVNRGNQKSNAVTISGTYNSVEEYIAALNKNEKWVIYDKKTNTAKITSVEAFMKNAKQLQKSIGAFDDMNKSQPENTLFGLGDGKGLHFDSIMAKVLEEAGSSKAADYKADLTKKDSLGSTVLERMNMYNPMYYLSPAYSGYKTAKVAKYWRVHAGIFQGDTAVSTELAYSLALKNYGSQVKSVDFTDVWGLYHTEAERTGTSTGNFIQWVKDCLK